MSEITFEKAVLGHKDIIFSWLSEPHIKEFWDNTQGHKDDIINFMEGRKTPSSYCDGKYIYWIAKLDAKPFAMLMTIQEIPGDCIDHIKLDHISKTGHTYGIDYMIGNKNYLGRGYGAKTLKEFIDYFRDAYDSKADTFLIDPAIDNPKAKHVYLKAGFEYVADFVMGGNYSGSGKLHCLLIKRFQPTVVLRVASINDYPLIQNMARFYVYDLSRECGHISSDWQLPKDGLYQSFDFRNYFEDEAREAYLIWVYDEIAGFILLNQVTASKKSDWNMGEFFVIAKFQNSGIGKEAVRQIWQKHPGIWEVSVIPENKSAIHFWRRAIFDFTKGDFTSEVKAVDFDQDQPKRLIFKFTVNNTPV